MILFYETVIGVISLIILIFLYRVLRGPTVFDRVLGLNGISSKAILLLIVIGSVYGRLSMFVDIALGYALINLIGALATATYLEHREG